MRKKVLHLFRNLKYGGNQALAYNMIRYSSPEYSHSILSLHDDLEMKEEFESLGCQIKVILHKASSFKVFKGKFEQYVKENEFTTIVTWFYPYVLRLNIEGVNFVHHIGTAPLRTPFISWAKSLLLVKLYSNNEGKFVFASRHIEKNNEKSFCHVFKNSCVIHNGIDTSRFVPKKNYNHSSSFIITMVGRLDGSKDFDTLIKIAKQLSLSIANLKINIVGDGEDRNRLEKLSSDYGAARVVSFLGRRADIPEILHDSDLYVFLNKPLEGFGLVIVEAMSAGLPVISYDSGANPEIIESGVNGFLVSSEITLIDKIKLISNSVDLARNIGQTARKTVVNKFDVQLMVKEYEKLY